MDQTFSLGKSSNSSKTGVKLGPVQVKTVVQYHQSKSQGTGGKQQRACTGKARGLEMTQYFTASLQTGRDYFISHGSFP